MLTANELISDENDGVSICQVYTTIEENDKETKQLVVSSKNTTLKKKYSGPQIYTVKIRGRNGEKRITERTEVKVYCSCHDFIFRRAYCLNLVGSLLIPEGFLNQPPNVTNPDCTKMYCKHVSEGLKYLIRTHK